MSLLKKLIADVVREVVTDVAVPILVDALTKKPHATAQAIPDGMMIRDAIENERKLKAISDLAEVERSKRGGK